MLAQVLVSFANGRFEGWLSMRTLKPQQMGEPAMAARIARRLRRFHAAEVPGSQEPQTFTVIKRWCSHALACFRPWTDVCSTGLAEETQPRGVRRCGLQVAVFPCCSFFHAAGSMQMCQDQEHANPTPLTLNLSHPTW